MDPEKFQKPPPKVRSEDRIAIADDAGWKAMYPNDVSKEERRHVRCIDFVVGMKIA